MGKSNIPSCFDTSMYCFFYSTIMQSVLDQHMRDLNTSLGLFAMFTLTLYS